MKSNLLYKVFTVILSIPLIALIFGGCSGNLSESEESSQANSSTTTASVPADISQAPSSPAPESEAPSTPAPEAPENWEDFTAVDGLPVAFADATVDEYGYVAFDYAPVAFPPAVYDDTFKNPELINWETMEFAPFDGEFKPTLTRLKAGDVLDNGLEVLEAKYALEYGEEMDEMTLEITRGWMESYGWVKFGGQITISGTLYCEPRDDYQLFAGELYFFPDTSEFPQLPVRGDFLKTQQKPLENAYPEAQLAVRSGTMFILGNVDDYDLEGVIERGKAAAVTLTLGEIYLQYANLNHGGRGGGNYAKIVDVKPR